MGLIFDAAGSLYGTTESGGTYGNGTVYELSPQAGGGWKETVLHDFGNKDGIAPEVPLVFDAAGNLYGTARGGGFGIFGTAFELMPQAGGGWTDITLRNFNSNTGFSPATGLIWDTAGNLYGTTTEGGAYNWGTAFELLPQAGGGWRAKVLHSFGNGTDGRSPTGLILDAVGNVYGTTEFGGPYGGGTVFELFHQAGGGWKETRLTNLGTTGTDPNDPIGLIFDLPAIFTLRRSLVAFTPGAQYSSCPPRQAEAGPPTSSTTSAAPTMGSIPSADCSSTPLAIFNGTTFYGGSVCGSGTLSCGTVFELTPQAGGGWMETVLYSFGSTAGDGAIPFGGLIQDSAGISTVLHRSAALTTRGRCSRSHTRLTSLSLAG